MRTEGRCVVLQAGRDSDYCLTTFLSGLSFCIHFHALTFFSRHSNQRRNLCTPHKFLRCIIEYCQMSQFSDPKGRRFESCQPHQKSTCLRYVGACFCCCMESVPARAALQPHHLPQLLLRFPLLLVERVGVNVQRRTGLGMTQQAGYRSYIHALGNQ